MTSSHRSESVLSHLRQLQAAERAQLAELRVLRDTCDVPAIAASLDQHIEATKEHGALLEQRLEELSSGPSIVHLTGTFGSAMVKGVVERLRPTSACDAIRDAIAAEAGELAHYRILELEAIRRGDDSTAVLAAEIADSEQEMLEVLGTFWHQAVRHDLDLADEPGGSTHAGRALLVSTLQLAHATERTALGGLLASRPNAPSDAGAARIEDHASETRRHAQTVGDRLRALGAAPSMRHMVTDLAVSLMNAPMSVLRPSNTEVAYQNMFVTEHMEAAVYGQLAVLAEAAGDEKTAALAQTHVREELAMADWLQREAGSFVHTQVTARA